MFCSISLNNEMSQVIQTFLKILCRTRQQEQNKQAAPWESLPADHLVWNPENAVGPAVSLLPPVAEDP